MSFGLQCESEQGDVLFRGAIDSAQQVVAPRDVSDLIYLRDIQRCLHCGRGPRHDWALRIPGHREPLKIVCPACGTEIG
jgi:hypothetical protein